MRSMGCSTPTPDSCNSLSAQSGLRDVRCFHVGQEMNKMILLVAVKSWRKKL
uniref:Uncharacterized protein n=1 Tax=Arundo donax TaxID=35708 RepID=A0A0A8ZBJ6_ARUDO